MKTIRYRSKSQDVYFLEEILQRLGYNVYISEFFGKDTDAAIKDFQFKNKLVVDGIVGPKTWAILFEKQKEVEGFKNKFLSENDLVEFSNKFQLELAAVKAVNEVESLGKGFLIQGRPRILFEGHVFWRQLQKRGINPNDFMKPEFSDILYAKWTKQHYKGGAGEYVRLEKAAGISDIPGVHDAAYCSASWGAFQIMGFHYKKLGYTNIDQFVADMYEHEREHLKAFGQFISNSSFSGKKLIDWLREKNWANFAHAYNGSGYKKNKYDIKLEKAYLNYSM